MPGRGKKSLCRSLQLTVWFHITCQKPNPTSIGFDYIHHKNEKSKPSEMDLPLLKIDIPNNLEPQKPVVYSETVEKPENGNL